MNIIDLFSGCGGLSLGFKLAGLEIKYSVELDSEAAKNYKDNIKNTKIINEDVKSFIENNVIDIDLLIGGPPCQGFCAINPKRSIDDPRNSGIDYFYYGIKKFKPKMFLIENVTGLISMGKGKYLLNLLENIKKLGYRISYKVLQAAHYGVPQSRWRLIIVGNLERKEFIFPKPTHYADVLYNFPKGKSLAFVVQSSRDLFSQYNEAPKSWDALSDLPEISNGYSDSEPLFYFKNTQSDYQTYLRRKSKRVHNHTCTKLGELQQNRVIKIPEGGNWKNLPDNLLPDNLRKMKINYGNGLGCNQRFRRLKKSELFSTILTSPHLYWGAFIHPTQNRVLSVREFARAQSFPDDYIFSGKQTSQYRQIGNAIPPLMARAIAEQIKNYL